jgi:hypothetical protein
VSAGLGQGLHDEIINAPNEGDRKSGARCLPDRMTRLIHLEVDSPVHFALACVQALLEIPSSLISPKDVQLGPSKIKSRTRLLPFRLPLIVS